VVRGHLGRRSDAVGAIGVTQVAPRRRLRDRSPSRTLAAARSTKSSKPTSATSSRCSATPSRQWSPLRSVMRSAGRRASARRSSPGCSPRLSLMVCKLALLLRQRHSDPSRSSATQCLLRTRCPD